jgi:hypothetical protein
VTGIEAAQGVSLLGDWTVFSSNSPGEFVGNASGTSDAMATSVPYSASNVPVSVGNEFVLLASASRQASPPALSSAISGVVGSSGNVTLRKEGVGSAAIHFMATWDISASATASGPGSSARAFAAGLITVFPDANQNVSWSALAVSNSGTQSENSGGSRPFSILFAAEAPFLVKGLAPSVLASGRAEVVPEP